MLIKMTKRFERKLDPNGNRVRIFPSGLTFNVDPATYDAILAAGAGEALETKNQEHFIAAEHDTDAGDEKLTEAQLMKLKHPDLVAMAKELEVEHADGATKQEITDAILAKQAEAEA